MEEAKTNRRDFLHARVASLCGEPDGRFYRSRLSGQGGLGDTGSLQRRARFSVGNRRYLSLPQVVLEEQKNNFVYPRAFGFAAAVSRVVDFSDAVQFYRSEFSEKRRLEFRHLG